MINKFIFSGLVEAVDETNNFIAFTVPTPNTGNILMNMSFDKKIVEQAAISHDNANTIITVEGFLVPGKDRPLDLIVTNVALTNVPNRTFEQA